MTLEGERLLADAPSFPNTGRVWWRLRDDSREELAKYLQWGRKAPEESAARKFLLEINGILSRSRLGLGYRQFDRILDYIALAQPFLEEDKALHFQLMQVVRRG
jgi:hypothetical protein